MKFQIVLSGIQRRLKRKGESTSRLNIEQSNIENFVFPASQSNNARREQHARTSGKSGTIDPHKYLGSFRGQCTRTALKSEFPDSRGECQLKKKKREGRRTGMREEGEGREKRENKTGKLNK